MVDCPHEGCTNSFYSEKNLRTHLKSAHGIDGDASVSVAAAIASSAASGAALGDFRSLDADFSAAVVAAAASTNNADAEVESRLCPFCGISLPTALYCAHLSMKHDIRSEGLSTVTGKPHKKRLPIFVKCPVCQKETQKKNVRNHLQLIHGITVTHENYPEFARQKVSGWVEIEFKSIF